MEQRKKREEKAYVIHTSCRYKKKNEIYKCSAAIRIIISRRQLQRGIISSRRCMQKKYILKSVQ